MMKGRTFFWIGSASPVLFLALAACSRTTPDENLLSHTLSPLRSQAFEENRDLSAAALKLNLTYQFLQYQFLRQGAEDGGAFALEKMIQMDPASAYLQLQLAREAFRKGDFEPAESHINRALTLDPKNSDIRREVVNVLAARGKMPEAYVHMDKLLDENPGDEELLNMAVSLDARRDDYWVSLKRLERALAVSEAPEYVHYKMGRVYRDMGKLQEARAALEKSVKIDPNYYQASTYLAILSEELGDEERAVELYEGLAHFTNNSLYHRKLSSLYMKRKDYLKAIEAFHNLLQLEPSDMNGMLQMARAWIEIGDLGKSEEKFNQLLSLDPANGTLRLMMGMLLEAQMRVEDAVAHYVLIQSDSPAYYDSMALRLKALHSLKRKDEMREHLEKSVTLAATLEDLPKSQALFRIAAQYLVELEDFERSEEVLSSALKRFPGDENLLYQKGMVFEKTKRLDQSIKVMLSILSINPQHVGALNYVGYTWADQGKNLGDAETFIKKALSFEPEDPFITDSLGWVYFKQERYAESYETLWKAYRKVPTEFVIVDHLADVLVKLGRLSEARDYYAKALHLKPDHPEMLASVQSKLKTLEAKLPPESRIGYLDTECGGRANRRCLIHWMQLDTQAQGREPARSSVSNSQ